MEQHIPGAKPAHSAALGRVALLVDGENISPSLAGQIITKSRACGPLVVKRVYGNAAKMPTWDAAPGFRLIHSGTGKNATDLLLAIDAMALAYSGQADTLIIVSSDRDFTHLANHLREKGHRVVGMGETKATEDFRKSCSQFIEIGSSDKGTKAKAPDKAATPLPKPNLIENSSRICIAIQDVISRYSAADGWLLINRMGHHVTADHGFTVGQTGGNRWRSFLENFPDRFTCEPKGPNARVRLTRP